MLACVASLSIHVTAQKLAIRHYQTADGLPHNNVKRILQDAKGYLWVATHEGLGRFDGYGFNAYGTDDGLGHAFINDMAIDREGNLWVATNGAGISRFIDDPPESSSVSRKKFESFFIADGGEGNSANLVNGIVFDTENRMWCVTDSGIYRSNTKNIASNQFERVIPGSQTARTNDALLDSRGRLMFRATVRFAIVPIRSPQWSTTRWSNCDRESSRACRSCCGKRDASANPANICTGCSIRAA